MDEGPGAVDRRRRLDEVRLVTALFADVVGSTSLGERLGPEEIRALIGECVSRVCETVETFGGQVGALMGDGVAAFFGLEVAIEDDVHRAVRAGLEILDVIERYAEEVRAAWGIDDFSVRVGINKGRVGVGTVGGADSRTTALGDPVNVAARLQSAAKPGALVVGRSVADDIANEYELESLGSIHVKGRVEPVEAFEVVRSGRPQGSRDSIFIGRLEELDALDAVVSDLQQGRGQVVLIAGEGGIGKTRLVEEFRRRVSSDLLWLDAHCDPIDHRTPYQAFAEPLRAWLGLDERATPIEVRVKLISRGRPLLGSAYDNIAPYLARLLGASLDPRGDRRLDGFPADVLTAKLLAAYSEWIVALSDTSPVILAIDNLDGVAESTADFVESLLSIVDGAQVLLIISMRNAPADSSWRVRGKAQAEHSHRATTIDVKPLSSAEAEELIAAADRDCALPDHLRRVVKERAEGNPLYIAELIGAMTHQPDPAELPRALESLLLSRIDALADEPRAVLQAAAVLGRVFRADILRRMGVVPSADAALQGLLRADVIRERGRRPVVFGFRHGLVRDAALATLSSVRLRELNALAAHALVEAESDEDHDVEALARYHLGAGNTEEATRCYENLAARLEMVFRYEDAARLLTDCLNNDCIVGGERIRLTRKLAELLIHLRRFDAALEALRIAESDEPSPDEVCEIALTRASALFETSRVDEAQAEIERCFQLDTGTGISMRAAILDGRIALDVGDLSAASHRAYQPVLKDLQLADAFECASLRAGVAAASGNLDDAEAWALKAQEFADRTGNLQSQLVGKRHLALICVLKGYVGEAYELMRFVYRQYEEVGDVNGQIDSAVNLAYLAPLVGRLDEGAEAASSALKVAGPGPRTAVLKLNLAAVEVERDNLDRAFDLASELLSDAAAERLWSAAHVVAAEARIAAGDPAEAKRHLEEAECLGNPEVPSPTIELVRAELALVVDTLNEALIHSDAALGAAPQSDYVLALCIERVRGEVLSRMGRGDGPLRTVVLRAERSGMELLAAYGYMALADGGPHEAEAHRRRAQLIFEQCGCRRGLRELEARRERALTTSQN